MEANKELEEIGTMLFEAEKWNLENEVILSALLAMKNNPDLSPTIAFWTGLVKCGGNIIL